MRLHREHIDEARLIEHLRRLMAEGSDGGFLTVTSGPDYWMQFVKNKTNYIRLSEAPLPPHLFWNAVSNDTLSPSRELADLQIAQVRMLGFVYPCDPHPIYGMYATGFVRIIDQFTPATIPTIAQTSCYLFSTVYNCPPPARLQFELELRGFR
jgi:hypothetical protein